MRLSLDGVAARSSFKELSGLELARSYEKDTSYASEWVMRLFEATRSPTQMLDWAMSFGA
jgi:hypothetical protein